MILVLCALGPLTGMRVKGGGGSRTNPMMNYSRMGGSFFFGDLYDVFLGYLLIETSYGLNFFLRVEKFISNISSTHFTMFWPTKKNLWAHKVWRLHEILHIWEILGPLECWLVPFDRSIKTRKWASTDSFDCISWLKYRTIMPFVSTDRYDPKGACKYSLCVLKSNKKFYRHSK